MKKTKQIAYDVLKNDFILTNVLVGVIALIIFSYMVLQRLGLLPESPCLVHDLFHIYCFGCGGTRALFALLRGELLQSLYYNPAVLLGIFLILHYEIGVCVTLIKKNGKRYYCNNLTLVILLAVVVIFYGVIRNYLLIACGVDVLQDFIP